MYICTSCKYRKVAEDEAVEILLQSNRPSAIHQLPLTRLYGLMEEGTYLVEHEVGVFFLRIG